MGDEHANFQRQIHGDGGGQRPVTGKVNATGGVKFKGKATAPGGSATVNGKGQLSATGRFFLGTMKIKGKGAAASQSGLLLFDSTSETTLAAGRQR